MVMEVNMKIAVFLIVLLLCLFPWNSRQAKGEDIVNMINYEAIGSSEYDPTITYETYNIRERTPISLWVLVGSDEYLDRLQGYDKFVIPFDSIDYSAKTLLITYGREIREIEGTKTNEYDTWDVTLTLTFSDNHRGNMVFFYLLPRAEYAPDGCPTPTYIANNDGRIYVGNDIAELNEYVDEK